MTEWMAEVVKQQKNRLVDLRERQRLADGFWKRLTAKLRACIDEFDRETEHIHGFKESEDLDNQYNVTFQNRAQDLDLSVSMDISAGLIRATVDDRSRLNELVDAPDLRITVTVKGETMSAIVENTGERRVLYGDAAIGELIAHNFLAHVATQTLIRP